MYCFFIYFIKNITRSYKKYTKNHVPEWRNDSVRRLGSITLAMKIIDLTHPELPSNAFR